MLDARSWYHDYYVDCPAANPLPQHGGYSSQTGLLPACWLVIPTQPPASAPKIWTGDTSGALRLGFLAALPMFATDHLPAGDRPVERAIDEVSEYAEAVSKPQPAVVLPEIARPVRPSGFMAQSELMTLLKALGMMLEKEDPAALPKQIVSAVANVLEADVAVLAVKQDAGMGRCHCRLRSYPPERAPWAGPQPGRTADVGQGRSGPSQMTLLPKTNLHELVDFYTRLDIGQSARLIFSP